MLLKITYKMEKIMFKHAPENYLQNGKLITTANGKLTL